MSLFFLIMRAGANLASSSHHHSSATPLALTLTPVAETRKSSYRRRQCGGFLYFFGYFSSRSPTSIRFPAALIYPSYYPTVPECNRELAKMGLVIRQWHPQVGLGLFATRRFEAGEEITDFRQAQKVSTPTFLSVQVGENEHVDDPIALARLNHSNHPNVFIDAEKRKTFALEPIEPGTLLTFWYPSTEWNMAQPFEVFGEPDPELRFVRGARYLPTDVLRRFRLNTHVEQLISRRDASEIVTPVLPVALGGQKTWQVLTTRPSSLGVSQFNEANDLAYTEMGIQNLRSAAEAIGLDSFIDLKEIKKLFRPNQHILDVGGADGRVLLGLQILFPKFKLKMTSIEPNKSFYEFLSQKFADVQNVSILNRNILRYESSEKYDLVLWMFSGFTDLAPVQQLQAFQRARQLMKTGALLVIDLPVRSPSSGMEIFAGTYQEYKIPGLQSVHYSYTPTMAELRLYAEQSGMNIREVREYQTPNGGIRDAFIFEAK